jgi:hypothetical protein
VNQYQSVHASPGTRPAHPVTSDTRPDDWLCCWAPRQLQQPSGRPLYWELKFIHRSCHLHNRLATV